MQIVVSDAGSLPALPVPGGFGGFGGMAELLGRILLLAEDAKHANRLTTPAD